MEYVPDLLWWLFLGAMLFGWIPLVLVMQWILDRRERRKAGKEGCGHPLALEERGHLVEVVVSGREVLERAALEEAVLNALAAANAGEFDYLGGGTSFNQSTGVLIKSDFSLAVEDIETALPVIVAALRTAGESEETEIRVDGVSRRLVEFPRPD